MNTEKPLSTKLMDIYIYIQMQLDCDETDEKLIEWHDFILDTLNQTHDIISKLENKQKDYDTNLIIPITQDVINELKHIAEENDITLEQLCRDMIDFFILNTPE